MDRVRVVDLRNGKERWTAVASQNFITALAFSPDGTMLATAAGFAESDIRLWEVSTGKEIGRLEGHTSWVGSLVFWPGGKKLASSSADQTIRTWDLASRICTDVLRGHRQEVWRLALLPDNRTLVSGCKDGVVCLWDTSVTHQRKEAISWSAISAWCFAPDSQSVLTLDTDRQVALWSGTNFQKKEPLLTVGIGGFGYDLFARDGRFVACAAPDGNVSVWDLSSRTLSSTFKPAGKNVLPIKFHVDGTRLLVWSLNDSRLRDWDLAADREVQSWSVQRETMRFGWDLSRDQHQLAMAPLSGKVSIRNLAEKSTLNPNLDILEVGSVAFAPSGKMLAMTSLLGYVRVWETGSWREIATLRGYLHGVYSLAFSPDGQRIVTGCGDQTAKVWDAASGRELLTLTGHSAQILTAAFSPDGQRIVTGSVDQTAKVWEAARAEQFAAWQEEERAAAEYLAGLQRERTAEHERQRIARAGDEGAIKRWLILAPIALATGQSSEDGLDVEQIEGEGRLRPKAGKGPIIGSGELTWQEVVLEDYVIDFNVILGHRTTYSVAYAVCYIRSEAEQHGLRMLVGSDDSAKVYLNGKQIHKYPFQRWLVADEDVVPDIALNKGLNVLVFKVVNGVLDWKGSIRFTDAQGNPVKGIKVTLDPEEKDSPSKKL